MKLLVLSDIHLEFGTFDVPTDIEYDIAILAGDIAVPGVKAVHWEARASRSGRASDVADHSNGRDAQNSLSMTADVTGAPR